MTDITLTVQQAADYLRISKMQVLRLVKQGDMPYVGGSIEKPLFSQCEIDAWASRRILGFNEKRLNAYSTASESLPSGNAFLVSDLLSVERIDTALQSKTKASVIQDVTEKADKLGLLFDPRDLLESLKSREELCSTAIGNGVAILHPRHHDQYLATESFMLLAIAAHPVYFGAPDGKPTDIFFTLVCQDDRMHLRLLTRLCVMCLKTSLLEKLRDANDAAEILAAMDAAERETMTVAAC